ncbi:hypothetical protein ACHAWO_003509 [Cyclotella atomus]|uniref:Uncharacterized protein n=1 Tax=Cyclotella atomus TaxID=382360 RepID=A0ABD3PIH9_9STRA
MRECLSKLAAVALLLNAPKEYAGYLTENVALVVVEKTGSQDAAAVVPILLVLQKLAQANSAALQTTSLATQRNSATAWTESNLKKS